MNKSYRRKIVKRIGLVCFGLVTLISTSVSLYEYQKIKERKAENEVLVEQLKGYQQSIEQKKIEEVLLSNDMREVYFEGVDLPEHLQEGDKIDIRIRYFNAEEYIVLAGKKLVMSSIEKGMILTLTEDEILYLSSAMADCENYKNTKLYVVGYPEKMQSDEGPVNYIARREILAMLGKETIKGESRIALEQRLMQGEQ